MPSHLPNLSGDVPRQQGSAWADSSGAGLGLFEAETILSTAEDLENLGPPEGHRRHERQLAPPCRPVPIQFAQPDGTSCTEWFYADILDISLGGLCLLITESHVFEVGQTVMVDFKAHRSSDLHRVLSQVRWFVRSGSVTTMGLGFVEPIPELPQLLPERRNRLRNPNEETKT